MTESRVPNRLAEEKSPYLLQHAFNPVDWYPWGEAAFARARAENRPLFVSIGYSTCHWCHVMERESFESLETARLMNELFVNVKVDREERPDVDQIYMQAVMAMAGQGGWPLSIWLTPDLRPFYGGTYFPPDRRWGRPSFQEVLRGVAELYRTRIEDVEKSAQQLMDVLRRGTGQTASVALPEDLSLQLATDLEGAFDEHYGGFGKAPKFPRPAALTFLVHHGIMGASERARAMHEKTLEMMWRGGIYDHVGGGFSRYSVDERWLVPHFEKMLYDQAQLVEAYLDGLLLAGREDFGYVVRDILGFVTREMTHPEGGFYSGQDADSEGEEGKFYVFTLADLELALGEDSSRAARLYGATEQGNFEGANILHWPRSPAEAASLLGLTIEQLRSLHLDFRNRLYEWRERRVRPGLDDKVLTSWNGLMIGAFARAGAVLGEPSYIAAAEKAARFIDSKLRAQDGTLLRRWRDGDARFEASLDDHAYLAFGLFSLFQTTGRSEWLGRVRELLEEIEQRYGDENGGYFFAASSDDLPVRLKESYDGALPSGNSVAALLWARVGGCLGQEDLRAKGLQLVESFAAELTRHPEGYPLMLVALDELKEPPRTLQILGDPASSVYKGLFLEAHRELCPGRVIVPVTPAERAGLEALDVPLYGDQAPLAEAQAFLCEEATCRPWRGPSQ